MTDPRTSKSDQSQVSQKPVRDCCTPTANGHAVVEQVASTKRSFLDRTSAAIARHKDAAAAIADIVTIAALIAGGLWTYLLTKQFRNTVPRLAIKHEVGSWNLKDGSVLVRAETNLTNSGKVLIRGLKGDLLILRMLPETKKQADEYSKGRVLFQCSEDAKASGNCVPEQGLNLPSESITKFQIADLERTLEPGETESYWRFVVLDKAVRVIEVHTFIENPDRSDGGGWTADTTHNISSMLDSAKAAPSTRPLRRSKRNVP